MKSTLDARASFNVGMPKRQWQILVRYLGFFRKYGWVELITVTEGRDGELVYWMKNSVYYYRLVVSARTNWVVLDQVYYSSERDANVAARLQEGHASKRKTYGRMLRRMRWARSKGRELGGDLICSSMLIKSDQH